VIAELFLDGKAIFDLGQLLSYRKGEYDPEPRIRKIGDPHIESLVLHMIQKEPEKRFSALEYIDRWYGCSRSSSPSIVRHMPCSVDWKQLIEFTRECCG
jgi:phosphoinositide-3-kinase regulatory subunit 4